MMDYFVANSALTPAPSGIQSTAGAVPVKNDKGEVSMKKVKVHRYVSGKRPEYAPTASSDEESEEDDFMDRRGRDYEEATAEAAAAEAAAAAAEQDPDRAAGPEVDEEREKDDPRLRRLTRLERERDEQEDDELEGIRERRRRIEEPEVLIADAAVEEAEQTPPRERIKLDSSESSDDEELSEDEIERRRESVRKKALQRKEAEEELIKEEDEEEKSADSSESSSEYEEYTDSEEETGPRLKPVFVRKSDRVTVLEKAKEAEKRKLLAVEAEKLAEQRKKASKKLVEECVRQEQQVRSSMFEQNEGHINDVVTDDENDELVYEAWKLRELKRNKRDREERETREKERLEIERLRNMTEEERRAESRLNPKTVTNKAAKGKYKFLQKYYHRGAFYLDKDDHIYKRDFSGATLEDHFDKTVLPKVMQVKNFGRSGRTKYTHLVDQDTTQFDSPWISETAHNLKFYNNQAAGVKQIFEKPTLKKKKADN